MKPITRKYLWLGLAMFAVSGCATDQQAIALKPVGPTPTVPRHIGPQGFLIVYTPIVEPKVFPDTQFAPHRGYEIFDPHGNLVRTVRNHVGAWDETPDTVMLPPGRYTVKAESATGFPLVVPVLVRSQKTTSVNIEWLEPDLVSKR